MVVQHYSSIVPLLLNVLQNANGVDYRKLRVKTMEYAVLICVSLFAVLLLHMAITIGQGIFHLDANTLVKLLIYNLIITFTTISSIPVQTLTFMIHKKSARSKVTMT